MSDCWLTAITRMGDNLSVSESNGTYIHKENKLVYTK